MGWQRGHIQLTYGPCLKPGPLDAGGGLALGARQCWRLFTESPRLLYTLQQWFCLCRQRVAAWSTLSIQRGGGNLLVPDELVNKSGRRLGVPPCPQSRAVLSVKMNTHTSTHPHITQWLLMV